jgi:hypothetical protein
VTVSWFGPQNQVAYGLLVAPQNRREDEDGVGHVLRSSGFLRLEANQVRVSQSSLKTRGGMAQMVHVASSRRLHRDETEGRVDAMGYIKLFYPNFSIFVVLGHKGSLVISFTISMTQGLVERQAFSHPSPTPLL